MKDEARLALEQLLSGGIVHIRAAYRKALSDGMEKPIVAVIDARDPKGRKILEGLTGTEAVGQPAWLIPQYRNAWIVTGRPTLAERVNSRCYARLSATFAHQSKT